MIPVIYPQNQYVELPNGMTVRGLIEQVQKNTLDIYNHYQVERVLADFGIRVIGQLETKNELPEDFTGEYGDAFAVGAEAPFDFYVWTRANAVSPTDYWLDIGPLAIVGPQGVPGPAGERGPQGEANRWFYTSHIKYLSGIGNNNDMALTDDGYVYRCFDGVWSRTISVIGPAGPVGPQGPIGKTGSVGPRGPQGEPGIPGSLFTLLGQISGVEELPDPASVPNNSAYIDNITWTIWYSVDNTWYSIPFTGTATAFLDNDGNVLPTVSTNDFVHTPAGLDDATFYLTLSKSSENDQIYTSATWLKNPYDEFNHANGILVAREYSGKVFVPTSGIVDDTSAVNKKYVDERAGGSNLYKTVFHISNNVDLVNDGYWDINIMFEVFTTYNPQAQLQAMNGSADHIDISNLIGFLYSQNFAEGGSSSAQKYIATGHLNDPGGSTMYIIQYIIPTNSSIRMYYASHSEGSVWYSYEEIGSWLDSSPYIEYSVYKIQ